MAAVSADSSPTFRRTPPGALRQFAQRLRLRWQALDQREQTLISAAAFIVGTAIIWWVAVAPALGILKSAPLQRASVDAQFLRMQTLEAEAKVLQAQPKLSLNDATRTFEASVKQRLGAAAQLSFQGSQASVTLRGVPAEALTLWLNQARVSARAIPIEARLRRNVSNAGTWDGTLVLALPAQ